MCGKENSRSDFDQTNVDGFCIIIVCGQWDVIGGAIV